MLRPKGKVRLAYYRLSSTKDLEHKSEHYRPPLGAHKDQR